MCVYVCVHGRASRACERVPVWGLSLCLCLVPVLVPGGRSAVAAASSAAAPTLPEGDTGHRATARRAILASRCTVLCSLSSKNREQLREPVLLQVRTFSVCCSHKAECCFFLFFRWFVVLCSLLFSVRLFERSPRECSKALFMRMCTVCVYLCLRSAYHVPCVCVLRVCGGRVCAVCAAPRIFLSASTLLCD